MYLVVFFLLLWTLFQCILCKNCLDLVKSPDRNTLYVLSVQNDIYNSLRNRILRDNYEHFLNSDINNMDFKTNCPGQLQGALKLTKNMRYVIYDGITDFYNNNYNDVRNSNMKWAGDYGGYKEQTVCTSDETISHKGDPYIGEIKKRVNCSLHLTQKYSMLISKYINVTETPSLYDFIYSKLSETNDERSNIKEYNIIVCNEYGASNRMPREKIIFKDTLKTIRVRYYVEYTCKQGIWATPNVIAIIAPGPEYLDKCDLYADKPIVFYDAMNNYQMVDMYKNSITRETELKDEVRALWILISQRWRRVAILSDGSAESGAFENEVRTLFDLKEVSYTVRSVEGQNFNEALSSLQSVDARIIIANVDQKYADLLVQQAQKMGMTRNQNIVWITRAWSKATCLRAAKDLQTILTVTVKSNAEDPEDAIRVIKTLFEEHYEYSGFLTEAKFAQDIRKKYLKYQKYFNFQVVRTESSGKQFKGINNAIRNMPGDRGECTLRSDNFDRPCDDITGVMIALVIVVLAVTILGITYFFDEPNTPYNRMFN